MQWEQASLYRLSSFGTGYDRRWDSSLVPESGAEIENCLCHGYMLLAGLLLCLIETKCRCPPRNSHLSDELKKV